MSVQRLETLSVQVSYEANNAIREVWVGMSIYPRWALEICNKDAVSLILKISRDVIRGLGLNDNVLNETSPDELAYYWRESFLSNFDNVPPRSIPDVNLIGLSIARKIAVGISSMSQQSKRYRDFLKNGAPPGMPIFPEYVGGSAVKNEEIPWNQVANSCAKNRNILFHSDMAKLPRREQSMRSTTHDHSDIDNPGFFV